MTSDDDGGGDKSVRPKQATKTSDFKDFRAKVDKLIAEYAHSDWEKVHRSRGSLAGNLTSQCKKSQSLYDKAIKSGTFYPNLINENIQFVKICFEKLEYFCAVCVASFSEEDKIARPDEFAASETYLEKYKASASLAIDQMESILRRAPNPASAASTSQSASRLDEVMSASGNQQTVPGAGASGAARTMDGGGGGGGFEEDIENGGGGENLLPRNAHDDDADEGENEWGMLGFSTPPETVPTLTRPRHQSLFFIGDQMMQPSADSASIGRQQREEAVELQQPLRMASQQPLRMAAASGTAPSTTGSSLTSWQPSPAIDISAVGPENQGLALMARSISASLDIKKLVPTAFDGTASNWQEWFIRWQSADRKMAECSMPFEQRLLLLLERVVGTPKTYLRSLPLCEPNSYIQAVRILINLQAPQVSKLRETVHKFLGTSRCLPTFASRSAMHGKIISYKHAVSALSADSSTVLACFELFVIERALDHALLKEHVKFCERKRNSNNLLGFDVSVSTVVDNLYQVMLTDLKLQTSTSVGTGPHPGRRVHFRANVHAITNQRSTTGQGRSSRRDTHVSKTEANQNDAASFAVVAGTPIKNLRRSKLTPSTRNQSRSVSPGARFSSSRSPSARPRASARPPGTAPSAPSSAHSRQGSASRTSKPKCFICDQRYNHQWPATCPLLWGPNRIESREARSIAIKHSLCRVCLQKHPDLTLTHGSKCSAPEHVKCKTCGQRHHAIFCQNTSSASSFQVSQAEDEPGFAPDAQSVLPIVTALALANGNALLVRVLIDSASSVNLVRSQISEALHLNNGPYSFVQLNVASGATVKPIKQRRVEFELCSLDKKFSLGVISALTTQRITGPLDEVHLNGMQKSFLSKQGYDPTWLWKKADQVDILLDTTMSIQLLGQPCIPVPQAPSLKLIGTKLGPALAGKLNTQKSIYNQCNILSMQELAMKVENYFSLESIGITEKDTSLSLEGQKCQELMTSLTTYDSEKRFYRTGLLWRRDPSELKGNNFNRARSVCITGKNKALRSGKSDAVDEAFREKLEAGCAERIPEGEIHTTKPHLYLSCHPIYKEAALSTRIRLVYNGSQPVKESGLSINDLLYMGNLQIQRSSDIIMRTRHSKVLLCLDLKKAYWAVKVRPCDAQFLRYVWIYGHDQKIQHYRHTTLVFGLSPSGFQLQFCMLDLAQRFESLYPKAAENLRNNSFIDDLFLPTSSVEEARQLLRETRQLLSHGSFASHKYASNCKEALDGVSPELISPKDDHKILGLGWQASSDEFFFDASAILSAERNPMTRRRVLSLSSMLFDVMGFLQPYTLKSRLIIKELWEIKNLRWDDEIPTVLQEQFNDWLNDLVHLKDIRIKRFIKGSPKSRKLCIFSDATKQSVCACAYLVTDADSGLIFSKTKTSPLRKTAATDDVEYTIVRMETLACLMAARMKDYIFSAFPENFFVDYALFIDSLVVHARLMANKPHLYKPWTSSRITEILRRVDASHIFYCDGARNCADVGCRSVTLTALKENELWFKAPPFVRLSPDHYPKKQTLTRMQAHEQNLLDAKEFKKSQDGASPSLIDIGEGDSYVTTRAQARKMERIQLESNISSYVDEPVSPIIGSGEGLASQSASPERPRARQAAPSPRKQSQARQGNWLEQLLLHFSWNKTVRITAYVLRFVQISLKNNRQKIQLFQLTAHIDSFPKFLTVPELRMATLIFIKLAQKRAFSNQLDKFDRPKPRTLLAQYCAFKDDNGLLRSTTRLINSKTLPYSATRPIILPKSEISNKIVLNYHIKNNHCGHSNTAYHLQRLYKIEGGRQTIRRVLYTCPRVNCLRLIPLQQTLSPLPATRLDPAEEGKGGFYAFQNASLDFAGYFLVKHECQFEECPHPSVEKVYCALYTCFLTRGCTLVCITNLGTESFLQSLIQFISRRGKPNRIYADNGAQIRRGEREIIRLYKSIQWDKVGEAAAERGIHFDYALPYAQFQNGISERIIQSVKRGLKKVLGNAKVTLSCFTTCLSEVEAQINSRPLIAPSLESFSETVTPALLMLGRNLDSLPLGTMKEADQALPLTRYLAHRKKLMNDFWRRWRVDYISSLALSKFSKRPNAPILRPGMVVLLKEGGLKREFSLARIEQILPSADSVQRRLLLRTPKGRVWRHANQVSLMECSDEATSSNK